MAFDVFGLRDRVVGEYKDYLQSFIYILDQQIDKFVRDQLGMGRLWPEAVLQLNPAFQRGADLETLANRGTILPGTARFLGEKLRLYRHQELALERARERKHYVVSTGTGSGKSLTYLLPIVDDILRNNPHEHSVRAIVVYPMNALINSQLDSLKAYAERYGGDCPIRFARYTGQDRQEDKEKVLNDPPHILLTNYVMLEYMMLRPADRAILNLMTGKLRFLVADEIHVYRGRQGADVAMLMRRLRQSAGSKEIVCVGTSATIATEGGRAERQREIATAGSRLFGVTVDPESVIDETLQRVTQVPAPSGAELRAAVEMLCPGRDLVSLRKHPLAAWIEDTFGIREIDGHLVRQSPISYREGLKRLVKETGLPDEECDAALKAALEDGNNVTLEGENEPFFAFRLHQFLSSGNSVFATIEPPEKRVLTMEGRYAVQGGDGEPKRLLFPLAFCRECGQEYHMVAFSSGRDGESLGPRAPELNAADDESLGDFGYFAPEVDDLWQGGDNDLPDSWFNRRRNGERGKIKPDYAAHRPQRMWVAADGRISRIEVPGTVEGWFAPRPFAICLRCRSVYDLRPNAEFARLATLSQTGRSTATTILSGAIVAGLGHGGVEADSRKVLSFTDNRQDASFQAGHINDFSQVALLRSAVFRAVAADQRLALGDLGAKAFDALDLAPELFMKTPAEPGSSGWRRARGVLIELLEYRALTDLARAWRVAQPNLEQCGLVEIEYDGLSEIAADQKAWETDSVMSRAGVKQREHVLRVFLDHLRRSLAISAPILGEDQRRSLVTRAASDLREPWVFETEERLRGGIVAYLPSIEPGKNDDFGMKLGARSALNGFLKASRRSGLPDYLTTEQAEELVRSIVRALRGNILTVIQRHGEDQAVQINSAALKWTRGRDEAPGPDPVRCRHLHMRKKDLTYRPANDYFRRLYQERATTLAGLHAQPHTGAVANRKREEREDQFREGRLPVLCSSPTMELGIDIKDLYAVHMRNVPPTPANYAQRSGRAGRRGRPALIVAFASQGNSHDQYFFARKERMISGSVVRPRFDLANEELLRAHLHSVWMQGVGISLGRSMVDVLDHDRPQFPVKDEILRDLELTAEQKTRIGDAFKGVCDSVGEDLTRTSWYSDRWRQDVLDGAGAGFQAAFESWRELYQAAVAQRDVARKRADDPHADRKARDQARREEREAIRDIELLLNQSDGSGTESDFYTYRYLGSQGFIPGYNFPRLPVRALVRSGDDSEVIDRPRFLGLSEFGPNNIVYHEGQRHQVTGVVLGSGGFEARVVKAVVCNVCGYIHRDDEKKNSHCSYCRAELSGDNAKHLEKLFPLTVVRTAARERITSEEEERRREGYEETTQFRIPPGVARRHAVVRAPGRDDLPLIEVAAFIGAELWSINHKWRRSRLRDGFVIDPQTGMWIGEEGLEGRDPNEIATGVRPYVNDRRNIMFLRLPSNPPPDEAFLTTLAYALRRAIQVEYEVEEQEIQVELTGSGAHRRILLWEAAEGGIGIWERLINAPDGFAALARQALDICHLDRDTGAEKADWKDRCGPGCYDCLLSFSNQLEHRLIDRNLIKEYLLKLANSKLEPEKSGRSPLDQYAWLLERTDPASSFEREFLRILHEQGLALPDLAQHRPTPEVSVQVDFYYEREGAPGVCVFIDGPHHDDAARSANDNAVRDQLRNLGYRVISIGHDRPVIDQVKENADVFRSRS